MWPPLLETPQAKFLAAMALVAAFLFAYAYGRHDGVRVTEAAWMAEKAELNAQAALKLDEAIKRNRKLEEDKRQAINQTTYSYELKLGVLKNEKDRALARARTGGLYVNANCAGSGNALSATAAGSGVDSRIQRVRLPDEDADFLISFAADANRVVEQLTACQAILKQERE